MRKYQLAASAEHPETLLARVGKVQYALVRLKSGLVEIRLAGKKVNTESSLRAACDYVARLRA